MSDPIAVLPPTPDPGVPLPRVLAVLLSPSMIKSAISLSVVFSFVWASLGHAGALQLWHDDWMALMVFLGLGLGLSWASDILKIHAQARLSEAQAASSTAATTQQAVAAAVKS